MWNYLFNTAAKAGAKLLLPKLFGSHAQKGLAYAMPSASPEATAYAATAALTELPEAVALAKDALTTALVSPMATPLAALGVAGLAYNTGMFALRMHHHSKNTGYLNGIQAGKQNFNLETVNLSDSMEFENLNLTKSFRLDH